MNSKFKVGDKVRWNLHGTESDDGSVGEFITIDNVFPVDSISKRTMELITKFNPKWNATDEFVYGGTDEEDNLRMFFVESELEEIKNES